MECSKCNNKITEKYEIIPMYKNWCSQCIEKNNIKSYENLWNEWIKNKSSMEIDRLIEKYAISRYMIPLDGGFQKCPKDDSNRFMTRYEFYNYERLVEHWEQTNKYVCSYNILRIILPCFYCGSKCTPETRKIFNLSKMSFKCICGRRSGTRDPPGFSSGTLQCECYDVSNDYTNTRFRIESEIKKCERTKEPINDDLIKKLENIKKDNHEKKFICEHVSYGDCKYVCSFHDSTDLVVYPKNPERTTFVRGLTRNDIEQSVPNLLKYYDEDDYFMSYIFACLNCKKSQTFRGDHVAFEIGDIFECQHCNNPFTYIKISNKGPFNVPKEYQFIVDKINKKENKKKK